MALPKIGTYAPGSNNHEVELGKLTIFFSYQTPIAYHIQGVGYVVRQNEWGTVTGRHMNAIDGGDKKLRIAGSEFKLLLENEIKALS